MPAHAERGKTGCQMQCIVRASGHPSVASTQESTHFLRRGLCILGFSARAARSGRRGTTEETCRPTGRSSCLEARTTPRPGAGARKGPGIAREPAGWLPARLMGVSLLIRTPASGWRSHPALRPSRPFPRLPQCAGSCGEGAKDGSPAEWRQATVLGEGISERARTTCVATGVASELVAYAIGSPQPITLPHPSPALRRLHTY